MNDQATQKPNPVVNEAQAFYDRYPYPPPVADLAQYRRLGRNPARLRVGHYRHSGQRLARRLKVEDDFAAIPVRLVVAMTIALQVATVIVLTLYLWR